MNRRTFLQTSATAAVALPTLAAAAAEKASVKPVNKTQTAIGAYYLNAHM